MIRLSFTKIKKACGAAFEGRLMRQDQGYICSRSQVEKLIVPQKRGLKTTKSVGKQHKTPNEEQDVQTSEIKCIFDTKLKSQPINIDGEGSGVQEIFPQSFSSLVTPKEPDDESKRCEKCQKIIDETFGKPQVPNTTHMYNGQYYYDATHMYYTYNTNSPNNEATVNNGQSNIHKNVQMETENKNLVPSLDTTQPTEVFDKATPLQKTYASNKVGKNYVDQQPGQDVAHATNENIDKSITENVINQRETKASVIAAQLFITKGQSGKTPENTENISTVQANPLKISSVDEIAMMERMLNPNYKKNIKQINDTVNEVALMERMLDPNKNLSQKLKTDKSSPNTATANPNKLNTLTDKDEVDMMERMLNSDYIKTGKNNQKAVAAVNEVELMERMLDPNKHLASKNTSLTIPETNKNSLNTDTPHKLNTLTNNEEVERMERMLNPNYNKSTKKKYIHDAVNEVALMERMLDPRKHLAAKHTLETPPERNKLLPNTKQLKTLNSDEEVASMIRMLRPKNDTAQQKQREKSSTNEVASMERMLNPNFKEISHNKQIEDVINEVKAMERMLKPNVGDKSSFTDRKIDKELKIQNTRNNKNQEQPKPFTTALIITPKETEEFNRNVVGSKNAMEDNDQFAEKIIRLHEKGTDQKSKIAEDDTSKFYSTTIIKNEEELSQKIEQLEEPQVVVNEKPENEGFNVTPKVLGENYKYSLSDKQDLIAPARYDEEVNQSTKTPYNHEDKIFTKEMKIVGIPEGTKVKTASQINKNDNQTDFKHDIQRYADKEYFALINPTIDSSKINLDSNVNPENTLQFTYNNNIREKILAKEEVNTSAVDLELERIIRELPILSQRNMNTNQVNLINKIDNSHAGVIKSSDNLKNLIRQHSAYMPNISKPDSTSANVVEFNTETTKSNATNSNGFQYQKQDTEDMNQFKIQDNDRIIGRKISNCSKKQSRKSANRQIKDYIGAKPNQYSKTHAINTKPVRSPKNINIVENKHMDGPNNSPLNEIQRNTNVHYIQKDINKTMKQKVDEITLGLGIISETTNRPRMRIRVRSNRSKSSEKLIRRKSNRKNVEQSPKLLEFKERKNDLTQKNHCNPITKYCEVIHTDNNSKDGSEAFDTVPIMQDAVKSKGYSDPTDVHIIPIINKNDLKANKDKNLHSNMETIGISKAEYAKQLAKALGPIPSLDDNVPLTELLQRVRKRNKIIQIKNALSSLLVTQTDDKCNRKAPATTVPKSPPLNAIPPPPLSLSKPSTSKKNIDKFTNAAVLPNFGRLITISKKSANCEDINKSKAKLTEEVIEKLQNLGKILEKECGNLSSAFDEINSYNPFFVFAKSYEPWTPIPSWPTPKKTKQKKLVCPKHGCQISPPRLIKDPPATQKPCSGFPKKQFVAQKHFIVPLKSTKLYDLG